MSEIPIRPEAVGAAAKAFTGNYGTHRDHTRAAIAAFCEAEGLTVETREEPMFLATADIPYASMLKEQRLVGPWREVKDDAS